MMSGAIVFAGPSLRPEDRGVAHVSFRAPARQGDMLRAIAEKPSVIGLIDGYFGSTLCVHQKEILEVLNAGIPVLGAASMGALRAAELERYGMIGVGKIFVDYMLGHVTSDADVAVTHGPEELGYAATTVAMVDLRATLDAMSDAYPIDILMYLRRIGEEIHFTKRTIPEIAKQAGPLSIDVEAALRAHFVEQKRQDANALLKRIVTGNFDIPETAKGPPLTAEYEKIRRRALREI